MALLEGLEEVLQPVSLHDRVEVLHRHAQPVICHPVLSVVICPDLLAPVSAPYETPTEISSINHLLVQFSVHETCTEHLERSSSIL